MCNRSAPIDIICVEVKEFAQVEIIGSSFVSRLNHVVGHSVSLFVVDGTCRGQADGSRRVDHGCEASGDGTYEAIRNCLPKALVVASMRGCVIIRIRETLTR